MVEAIRHAREGGLPFFGICLGMQVAVIEAARNVLGLADSHSSEFAPECAHPVISLMESQQHVTDKGGTMRLGAYPCELKPGSKARALYGEPVINERHRHRYEFNCLYERTLTERGLEIVGRSHDEKFVEIVELPSHPWYVAVQFHPEFKSKPLKPHPLFAGFIEASHSHKLAARQDAAASVAG
jgi:CTP synthase